MKYLLPIILLAVSFYIYISRYHDAEVSSKVNIYWDGFPQGGILYPFLFFGILGVVVLVYFVFIDYKGLDNDYYRDKDLLMRKESLKIRIYRCLK